MAVPPSAADTCCQIISFFTTEASAAAWARTHPPEATGKILSQREAWQVGVSIFGPLLQP
jgi:Alkylmercury lyase